MTGLDRALPSDAAAFVAAVAHLYRTVSGPMSELTLVDGDVVVPGMSAFTTRLANGEEVRGWANPSGVVVLARRQNFGPVLDALAFAGEPAPDPLSVAARLAWSHGDDYQLVAQVKAGTLGIPKRLVCPPAIEAGDAEGERVLRFVLQRGDRHKRPAILAFQIVRRADGTYRTDVWQLAPKGDDDE